MRKLSAAIIVAILALPAVAHGATKQVKVSDNKVFMPKTIGTTVGNSIRWSHAAGSTDQHSVTQDGAMFNSGPSSAMNFTRRFSAGTFRYHCVFHGNEGMRGTVKVPPTTKAAPRGTKFTVMWATAATNTGAKYKVQYRIGRGAWRNWKPGTSTTKAVFGARNKPVRVSARKTYSFRVKSLGDFGAASAYSPARSFNP